MNLLNKILLGFVVVAILPFLGFASMVLKTHQGWMPEIPKFEKQIAAELDQQKILQFGDPADPTKPGVGPLSVALHNALVDRGGAWRGCTKGNVTAEGGMTVTIGDPDPAVPLTTVQDNIASKTVLFVFDEQPGGKYLGEFKVAAVNQKSVTLTPARKLSMGEIDDINRSGGVLTLSDVMPIDRHETFAGKDEAAMQQLLPNATPETIQQYVRDGQPKADNDDPDSVADGKFYRPLRDYSALFQYYYEQITFVDDTTIRVDAELKGLDQDKTYLKGQIQKTDNQIVELMKEFDRVKAERAVAAAHFKAVEERVAAVQAEIEKTLDANQKLAAQWTAIQTEAARRINEATATAPAGARPRP